LGVSLAMLFYLIILKAFKGSDAAVNGSVGWIDLKVINIQPLEIAKLALVIYLAYFLDRHAASLRPGNIVSILARPAMLAAVMMFLVIIEPDLGGTAILAMIVVVMFSVSGVPAKNALLCLIGIGLALFFMIYLLIQWNPKFLQDSYQYRRLLSFMHPFELEQKEGAQLVNSYYAIHNG
ncbi:cell division protein FtsW, partial [Lactobacillus sp. XV13L]|nr:cell division protein FtsW [Lactobacillus sp. XV13L]